MIEVVLSSVRCRKANDANGTSCIVFEFPPCGCVIRHALAMVEFMNWLDLGLWLSVGLLRLKYCVVEFVNTISFVGKEHSEESWRGFKA